MWDGRPRPSETSEQKLVEAGTDFEQNSCQEPIAANVLMYEDSLKRTEKFLLGNSGNSGK
jgi:hypothetical protein